MLRRPAGRTARQGTPGSKGTSGVAIASSHWTEATRGETQGSSGTKPRRRVVVDEAHKAKGDAAGLAGLFRKAPGAGGPREKSRDDSAARRAKQYTVDQVMKIPFFAKANKDRERYPKTPKPQIYELLISNLMKIQFNS